MSIMYILSLAAVVPLAAALGRLLAPDVEGDLERIAEIGRARAERGGVR